MTMYLETERMLLRDFRPEDAPDLQEILGDGETMKNLEPPYDMEKTTGFLRDFCIGKGYAFAAVRKETQKVIGYVLFKPYGEPEVYEIAWVFHRDYWRRGYAYEICAALIGHAFRQGNIQKIFAETIDPVKSGGLMKKLGMEPEGVQKSQVRNPQGQWADLYFYGLRKEDYFRE